METKITGMIIVDENHRDIHPCFIPDDAKVNVDCHRELLGINLQKKISLYQFCLLRLYPIV